MDPLDGQRASELFCRFRERGDPAALTGLFDLTAPELLAVALHLVRDDASAEDLVQDTFLLAIEKARRFDPERPVLPWLLGILLRETRKSRRRARRRPEAERLREPASPEGARLALGTELREAVDAALAGLPATYREVVRAHLDEGRSPRDIAERLGRAPGTVRVQLHRGLELLRRALPSGLALGALGVTGARGLAAVRAAVEREAVLRGPALAASGAKVLSLSAIPSLGVLAVSTKTLVAGGVVAALASILAVSNLASRADHEEPAKGAPARALDAPPSAASERVALESADELPAARRASAVAPPPAQDGAAVAPPLEAPATAVVLRGTITGATRVPEGGFEMTVQVGKATPRTKVVPLAGPGAYSIALDDLTGDEARDALSILVVLRAEGYVPSSAWATRAPAGDGDVVSYVADLEAHPVVRVLRGRVTAGGAVPEQGAWVAYLPDGLEPPLDWRPLTEQWLGSEGEFELALYDARGGSLLAVAGGYAIAHVAVGADDLGEIDLGTIELARGATIEGRASRDGVPLRAGSIVRAELAHEPSPWTLATRNVVLIDPARAAHRVVEGAVGEDGRFELTGLVAGVEYGLVAAPGRDSELGHVPYLSLGPCGERVTAPARGIELDWGLALVHLEVRSKGGPVASAHVVPKLPPGDSRERLPVLVRGGFGLNAYAGSDGRVDVLLARDLSTSLEVTAPGYAPRVVAVDPRDLDDSRTVVVELTEGEPPPKLTLRFRYDGPGTLDGAFAFLMLFGDKLQRVGPVPIEGDAAVFEAMPVGHASAHLSLHVPQSVAFEELPIDQLPPQGIDLSGLAPGEDLERVVDVGVGGRVELRLVGRDPALAPPSFELVEATGNVVRPPLVRPDPRGHDHARAIDGDGPYYLGRSLYEGKFTLRQVGAAYAEESVEVEVRRGRTTTVTFPLAPR